jgi:hypothetical protein
MCIQNFYRRMTKVFSTFILLSLLTINVGGKSFSKGQASQNNLSQSGLMSDLEVKLGKKAAKAIIETLTQEAKLTASDGAADDYFGDSVAMSGDTVVIGAIGDDAGSTLDQGSVYVFVKPISGWETSSSYTAKLTAPEGQVHQYFGTSVGINDDTIVIGAPYGDGLINSPGSVYVFVKPETGWVTTSNYAAKLTASDGSPADDFGWSVAISGDIIVVGSPNAHDDYINRGTVYIFTKPANGWQTTSAYTSELFAFNRTGVTRFGQSVAIEGDTIIVGTHLESVGINSYQGTIYVFEKPVSGWETVSNYSARLTFDGFPGSGLSAARNLAIYNDTIVVGANCDDSGCNAGKTQGAAYVFNKPPGGWGAASGYTAKLTAFDGTSSDNFGWSVAIKEDVIAIGARFAESDHHGAVYVFRKPDTGWSTTSSYEAKLTEPVTGDFGKGVAIVGDEIVIGAPRDTIGSNYAQGSVFIYSGMIAPPNPVLDVSVEVTGNFYSLDADNNQIPIDDQRYASLPIQVRVTRNGDPASGAVVSVATSPFVKVLGVTNEQGIVWSSIDSILPVLPPGQQWLGTQKIEVVVSDAAGSGSTGPMEIYSVSQSKPVVYTLTAKDAKYLQANLLLLYASRPGLGMCDIITFFKSCDLVNYLHVAAEGLIEYGWEPTAGDAIESVLYYVKTPDKPERFFTRVTVTRNEEVIMNDLAWWTQDPNSFNFSNGPDKKLIRAELGSPATLYITDPNGRSSGTDPASGELKFDFDIAISNEGDEPYFAVIPEPILGEYKLKLVGTGYGPYTISISALDMNGEVFTETSFSGLTEPGLITEYSFYYVPVSIYLPVVLNNFKR